MSLLLLFRSVVSSITVITADPGPLIGMRYSDDMGHTWSHWRWRPTGKAGEYKIKVRWNGNGSIKSPGRIFQFKITDETISRVSRLLMNVKS